MNGNVIAAMPVQSNQQPPTGRLSDTGRPATVCDAASRAARNLVQCQNADGAWEGEVVWCPVITAQVVLLDFALARTISADRRQLILRHFEVTRRPGGGWGLH